MLEKTRLEELAAELPEKERKALLERIIRRMEREDSDEAVAVELKDEEREKIIAFELKRAGWWVAFEVWLRSLLSGRRKRDLFEAIRLRHLRARIRAASPGMTGLDSRDLTPRFARRLWDLFVRLRPLLEPYRALTGDRALQAAAYTRLVERRLPSPRRAAGDFVTDAEMEALFAESGHADEIRKRLISRLADYVRAVPDKLIGEMEEACRLHLAIGRLAAFPFAVLFRFFGHALDESADAKAPAFEHAPAMLTVDLLERLHVAVTLVHRCGQETAWAPEPLAHWLEARGAAGTAPPTSVPAAAPSALPLVAGPETAAIESAMGSLRAAIADLCREVESFDQAVPLLDLIRYFRRDPWYNLVFNPPRLFLRNLYASALKERLLAELDQQMGAVRERVISRRMEQLLKVTRPVALQYYQEHLGFDGKALGLPAFLHVRSLTFLFNYLIAQYKGPDQEAVQLLSTTVLSGNRMTQNRLGQYATTLENLEARIVLFDRSLAPDEEDGRQLARLRGTIAADFLMQKAYRGFVAQKDREARDLIDKGLEALAGVRKVIDEVRTSAFESTRSALKVLHPWMGRTQTLGQILTGRSESIGGFLGLADQLLELEKGD